MRLVLTILVLLFFPLTGIKAVGLKAYPSSVRLQLENGKAAETTFEVTNVSGESETVETYTGNPYIRVVPKAFVLKSGQTRFVRAIVYEGCSEGCRSAIMIRASKPEGYGAGVEVWIEVEPEGARPIKTFEALGSLVVLLAILWITAVDKGKKWL